MMRRQQQQQDQQSRVFYELSALVLSLLRSPPTPIQFSDQSAAVASMNSGSQHPMMTSSSSRRAAAQISPAGFASLMLGISMALMLCGSVTFFIGFLLMPWVLGLVMVFYVAGVVSTLSVLGKSILCYASPPPPTSPRKAIPGLYCCSMEVIVIKRRGGVTRERVDMFIERGIRNAVVSGVLHIGGTNECIGNSA
ncbi:hypothetical protein ACLB2K_039630 [Fragaria x ananassa]